MCRSTQRCCRALAHWVQVAASSEEAAQLLVDTWVGYSYLMDAAATQLHEQYQSAKQRAEQANVRADMLELELMQEHEIHEQQKVRYGVTAAAATAARRGSMRRAC